MNDYFTVLKTLRSASRGYATAENQIGKVRGLHFRPVKNHWEFQPQTKRKKRWVMVTTYQTTTSPKPQ